MTRAIIIDDETHCIDRLSKLLKENCRDEILLMDSFGTYEDGLDGIKRLKPELIFLDVQLKKQTGFELLKQFGQIDFDVIFTTAYEKFAVQAFKFSAVDFLLKPIVAEELISAVNKITSKKELNEKAKKFETLFHNVKENQNKRITVATLTGFEYLNVDDIIRCESDVNYTTLFMRDKSTLLVSKTLKEFEELLSAHGFFRVHNSHLINTAFIKSYNKGKGGFVTLLDNKQIEVSTRRKDDFLNYLKI